MTGYVTTYQYPSELSRHHWGLQGKWLIGPENATAMSEQASLKLNFFAKNVFLVMGNSGKQSTPELF